LKKLVHKPVTKESAEQQGTNMNYINSCPVL